MTDNSERFEYAGKLMEGPHDLEWARTAMKCKACRSLVMEGDEEAHICLADWIADEVRSLREATDSYVSVAEAQRKDVRDWEKVEKFAQRYGRAATDA